MQIFRKHQRALLIFIFLVVGLPMLFFGLPNCNGPMNSVEDIELANVGGVPIMASEYRRGLSTAAQRQAQGGEVPSFEELAKTELPFNVLKQSLTSALVTSLANKQDFKVNQAFLEAQLRKDPSFQDDAGNFNGALYNSWVKNNQNIEWTEIYQSISEQLSRQAYIDTETAAANRVLDKDVDEELWDRSAKIQIEYIKVEPPVELTEAEIQAYYDDEQNKESYRSPQTYSVEYIAVSLKPEGPNEKVNTVLDRARAGEDFAALANELSDLDTEDGGDLGWLSERDTELDYRKPLFSLAVGAVSDAVKGPNGYYIYKVEEERTNEETQKREIKARHIYVKVELPEAERAVRVAQAEEIAAKVKADENHDLAAAIAGTDLTVQHASGFSVETTEIEGIPRVDAFQFRRFVDEEAAKEAPEFNVITGRDNLYVTKQIGVPQPGEIPPLADVRDQVIDDAKNAKKREDSYRELVEATAEKIKAEATTLDEVTTKFPELGVQIKETRPFTKKEYLYENQIYLQTPEIFDALEDKEVGALAGPLTGFLGGSYFVALSKRIDPTEEEKANWEEERKTIRENLLASARYELTMDLTKYLEDNVLDTVGYTWDEDIYYSILGIKKEDVVALSGKDDATQVVLPSDALIVDDAPATETSAEETPAEDVSAAEAPVEETSAVDNAPVEDGAPSETPVDAP